MSRRCTCSRYRWCARHAGETDPLRAEARVRGDLDGCTWLVRSAEGRGFGPILPGVDVARTQLAELLNRLADDSQGSAIVSGSMDDMV